MRVGREDPLEDQKRVSVEPLPKQGCEKAGRILDCRLTSLSGTPAEAGVRVISLMTVACCYSSLSGTPAEAGVRVGRVLDKQAEQSHSVSVEPLPKQGCEFSSRMP